MTVMLTARERETFKSCRRAWDFGAPLRRNLEPVTTAAFLDADRLVRDALAVYYFPGMWDWSRAVVLPLVSLELDKGLERELSGLGRPSSPDIAAEAVALKRLVDAYVGWAPSIERLAPVLVEVDYEADLADPAGEGVALRTRTGDNVRYRGRVDLLAVDEYDAYWIVRHRVVRQWTPLESLLRDEETVAACWAWERFYIGMGVAGTIYNELRVPADFEPDIKTAVSLPRPRHERGVPQSEGSGGGRSLPQHRRLDARAKQPEEPDRVCCDLGPWFRRTWVRRDRAEIEQAGRQLAAEVNDILDPGVTVYPSPSVLGCGRCEYTAPCQALYEGRDAEAILAHDYRHRRPDEPVQGRLGGATWSTGRGAAPPRFS